MSSQSLRKEIAGVVLTAGVLAGLGGAAFAAPSGATGSTKSTVASGSKFNASKVALEAKLTNRVTSLGHLAADVGGSATLSSSDRAVLSARIGTEQTNINTLVLKVPGDATWAQLNADRSTMYQDNRVYAVMTPQVFETIAADAAQTQLAVLTAEEPTLSQEVASLAGQPGTQNTLSHDQNFVVRVGKWSTVLAGLVTQILAQQPANYPGDQHFFVRANHDVLQANVAIAYANYDASVIALATGGYTGS